MTDLSIIIDPAGIPDIRDGINLQVFPSGDIPLVWERKGIEPRRSANERLIAKSWRTQLNFSTSFLLEAEQYADLQSLVDFNNTSASQLGQFETVIYNLVEPFTELSPTRTRFKVPDTDVISQIAKGEGLFRWTYWVATQGNIQIETQQKGCKYAINMIFTEGTRLLAEMEP